MSRTQRERAAVEADEAGLHGAAEDVEGRLRLHRTDEPCHWSEDAAVAAGGRFAFARRLGEEAAEAGAFARNDGEKLPAEAGDAGMDERDSRFDTGVVQQE